MRVKRARIRRLAPRTGCLEKDGATLRINHEGPEAAGVRLGVMERAFYAFNLKLVGLRHDPAATLRQLADWGPAFKGAMKGAGPAARSAMRMAPRAIAVAVVALLAVTGVTRFVHIDLRAVADSVHFGIPHFLTPWRAEVAPKATGTPVVIGTQSPQYPTAIVANGTPEQPAAQQAAPGQGAADIAAQGAYVPQYYRANKDSYLPLPADGPLPAGMSTYAHGSTQVPGVAALTVHEAFTEPEEAPADGVTLMAPAAVSAVAPEVQLLGSANEAKPVPRTESKAEARPEHKAETHSTRAVKDKGPVNLEVHSATEPKGAVRPAQQAHLANALSQSQMAVAPVVIPSQNQAPAQQSATQDLVLLKQPSAQQSASAGDDGQDEDPIPLQVHQAARRQAEEQEQPSGPRHPSFKVVTHTDDSIVVNVDGQMKQIPVGKTLPDGSKLLGVSHDGGGFTTNRGDYTAY
ncbi:hypothetical protein [Paraburkholderia youngii]|uniref:hypothetical protein n=1 Tax=Paraburkholderia youngii TaxID=2782701 RepID=UPI003D1F22A5